MLRAGYFASLLQCICGCFGGFLYAAASIQEVRYLQAGHCTTYRSLYQADWHPAVVNVRHAAIAAIELCAIASIESLLNDKTHRKITQNLAG